MELELKTRKPRWYEKRWEPVKPELYILEVTEADGKWISTYWWGGNYKSRGVEFKGPGKVRIDHHSSTGYCRKLIVGKSGTTLLAVKEKIYKIKGFSPRKSEWTCFGWIDRYGDFVEEVKKIDLQKEIEKSQVRV